MKLELLTLECLRCGHKWTPRSDDVRLCPKCKTPYFDKPKPIVKDR